MDRLFIRACIRAVRSPVDEVGRGRSVEIKRARRRQERAEEARCVQRYNRCFSYRTLAIHSDGLSFSLASLFLCSSPSFSFFRRPIIVPGATQRQTARRCCSCTVTRARKCTAPRFCRSRLYDGPTRPKSSMRRSGNRPNPSWCITAKRGGYRKTEEPIRSDLLGIELECGPDDVSTGENLPKGPLS